MSEYIEREAAYPLAKKICDAFHSGEHSVIETPFLILDWIDDIPAANVRPVVRGKWVDEPIKSVRYHCSVCQGRFDYTWRFCPNCGARMEES